MPKALIALTLVALLLPRTAAASDCGGPGGGNGGGGGGWGLLALIGLSTVICLTSTTSAGGMEASSKSSKGKKKAKKQTVEASESEIERKQRARRTAFVEANAINLRRDAAYGHGEYLDAYLNLYGCSDAARPLARALIQEHDASLFVSAEPYEILRRTELVLGLSDAVSAGCGLPPAGGV